MAASSNSKTKASGEAKKKASESQSNKKTSSGEAAKSKSGQNAKSRQATGRAQKTGAKAAARRSDARGQLASQLTPFCLYIAALLFLLVLIPGISGDGIVISFLRNAMLGLFSAAAFAVPILLVMLGAFWRRGGGGDRIGWQFWDTLGISFVFSILLHIVLSGKSSFDIVSLYKSGITYESGGVVGGFFASVFITCLGKVISVILLCTVMLVLCLLLFGLTPGAVYAMVKERAAENRARRREAQDNYEVAEAEGELPPAKSAAALPSAANHALPAPRETKKSHRGGAKFDPDVDISSDDNADELKESPDTTPDEGEADEIDKKIFDEVMRRTRERYGEQSFEKEASEASSAVPPRAEAAAVQSKADHAATSRKKTRREEAERLPLEPVSEKSESIDLAKIFVDPDAIALLRGVKAASFDESDYEGAAADEDIIEAERRAVEEIMPDAIGKEPSVPEPEAVVPVYEFPSLTLLAEPKATAGADIGELKETAQRLVDTLASFRVRTKISDIFHGPTITRYELTPDVGTRVSSIANLADDIALNLAAESVRIEAPIPGKAAVGVEVPNRTRETVYLRQLFDTDEFRNAKGLLTAALGCDVAGQPVYCNIAKMPHLLIAGTTGGGKSVCINCIIMSILYRTTPDQVRLIMIDPKQVEFVPYNGIPHLHVPVVSDMKKAAGTLQWAVGEMEKRYEMIRDVGMKNIEGYNKVTENDPEKPYMPYLVIFIDELADLMMTASDDVETPICRIAQKGRAAGVHIIIGTQRPSVDVVTGLIKANFPSRIALTSASQTDSRTILGTGGAEKLLGRGDMLYAPIGAPKPLRVQGAFVDEDEVDAVTEFLKGICPTPSYDEAAIDGIEEASRQCGNGKKGARDASDGSDNGGAFGDDPMMRQALELAVDAGKISTSLIQRRLSLGYGRAAKLIDRMEALGFVGPPDGSRPREVLISRQAFQELVLKEGLD